MVYSNFLTLDTAKVENFSLENNYHHYKTGCFNKSKESQRHKLLISEAINILYCIFLKLQTIYINASPSLFFNLTVKKSLHTQSRLNFEDQNKGYIGFREFSSISHKMFNLNTNTAMICWETHQPLIVWDQLSKLLSGVFTLYYLRLERSHHQQ